MTERVNRREFATRSVRLAAAATAASIVPRHVLGGPRHTAPSEKLNIAGIGVGGMGAATCATSSRRTSSPCATSTTTTPRRPSSAIPKAKVYTDYREMLDKQKDIDAVVIATPDHTHAVISMAAMQAGKHVYCQKPLTHDVYEARMLAQAAKEAGVATQMGIQGHSGEGVRTDLRVDLGRADRRGPRGGRLVQPDVLSLGPRLLELASGRERPEETPAVPAGLDWDLWIGPAPMRPYHRAYHPLTWRCWWDFGCGMMGDRGAHTLDPVFWALKLGAPTSIDATTCGNTPEVHPAVGDRDLRVPGAGRAAAVEADLVRGHPTAAAARPGGRPAAARRGRARSSRAPRARSCAASTATARGSSRRRRCRPATRPEKTIPRVEGSHEQDWVRACKTRRAGRRRLRLLRPADRDLLPGQRRQARRRPHRLGRGEPEGHQPARGPAAHPIPVSRRLGAARAEALRTTAPLSRWLRSSPGPRSRSAGRS